MNPPKMADLATLVFDVTDKPLGGIAPDVAEDNVKRATPPDRTQLPVAGFQSAI